MKLGIITGWKEECFQYAKNLGLEAVEFCCNFYSDSKKFLELAPETKALSEKYGLPVASVGRWGATRLDEEGNIIEQMMNEDKDCIDAASIMGCPVFCCGCNRVEALSYYDNLQKAIEYFSELVEYARPKGVKIAVYNCGWNNFVYSDKEWEIVLGAIPELGIKYDVSHCFAHGGDRNYLREIRDWGHKIFHFHIKGSLYIDGVRYDDPPAGLDQTNWGAVMDMLYTKNYNGVVSIEPHSDYWKDERCQWGIDYTIKYIRPMIMPDGYSAPIPYMP
ncbi:MAG: sugar phosphate isomerase/epimerase [Clostridia bacterium]|nr:sugar phosphate isomerase/epimerase [Clostridia bacterium]MBR4071476.1 sugar phosphate isomerase/epimerase [Clostridia bacterium]MBR6650620.1 sugar phosphate isomerase/epimerase [Clostridia bacterium]